MDCYTFFLLLVLSISIIIDPTSSISPALLLTPLINNNKTEEAKHLSIVNPSLFLNLTSHSGFLTIDPRFNSSTFFWYFPVAGKPVNETPWIVWLQGGPGATSLNGLFNEVGPFSYEDGILKPRQWTWNRDHSLLFIDNPVGTGYSFTDSEFGFATNMTTYSNHLYSALQQFLTVFPELRKAPLYIAGESYAGRFIPGLATRILEEGKLPENWELNLQGLIIGNPVLNREDIANLTATYYNWGLIDSQGVVSAKSLQDSYSKAIRDGNSIMAYMYRDKLVEKLRDISMQQQEFNILKDEYNFKDFVEYLARADVREAIHVGDIKFSYDNDTVHERLVPDFLTDVQTMIEKLLLHYKILIYCGQLDLTAPCNSNAEARRKKWHWARQDEFLKAPRVPWWYNESIAGYVKSGGGLTEALVRGAGHLVPVDKPEQAQQLVSSFIKDLDTELPPNFSPTIDDPDLNSYTTESTKIPEVQMSSTVLPISADVNVTKNQSKSPDVDTTTKASEKVSALPNSRASGNNGVSAGTIVSIVLNVILVLVIIGGAALYYKQKRRHEEFFYNNVDNNSDDIFLT